MIFAAVVVLSLIGVNAFYVGTEFALVSVRRARVRRLAEDGRLAGRLLLPVVTDHRKLYQALTACQIGITVSSLALGAFAEVRLLSLLQPWLSGLGGMSDLAAGSIAATATLLAVTSLQVVLGEMVPKSVALRAALPWAAAAALPLRWSVFLFAPLIVVLGGSARLLLRLLRVPLEVKRGLRSAAEIGLIVAESARAGAVDFDLRDGVHNALRFATRRARDVMVPRVRVRGVPEGVAPDELRRILSEADHTRLPVYRGSLDHIVGFIHAKDVLLRGSGPHALRLADLMRPALRVPWSARAGELMEEMRASHAAFAVVLDEYGGTAGIVTLEDLIEEVVGEVEDEFDALGRRRARVEGGRVELRGEDSLIEVNDRHHLELRSQEAYTVGGLIMEALGRIGRPGDHVTVGGVRLEIARMTDKRIEAVIATLPIDPKAPA